MSEENLYSYLIELPKQSFDNEIDFIRTLPLFVKALGYDDSEIFFEMTIGSETQYRADAIVAASRTARPWILIETRIARRAYVSKERRFLEERIYAYNAIAKSEFGVLLTSSFLLILHNHQRKDYDLDRLTSEQASEIFGLLQRPAALPESYEQTIEPQPKSFFSFDTFRLDRQQYHQLLQEVLSAKSNDEKKKSLEGLTELLFKSIHFLKVKFRNLRTSSSEIDLVIQNNGWEKITIFDEFGKYFLVECKNWASPVGAKEVRDFKGKLNSTKLRLGVLLSRNGVTGAHQGADALAVIRSAFDSENIFIIIIAEEDLKAVEAGKNFYEILEEKIDWLRFGLH